MSSPPPLFATLPAELLERALDYCAKYELAQLSYVNRHLAGVATHRLYQHVDAGASTILFLISACFYDHAAPLVRSLRLDLTRWIVQSEFPREADVAAYVKKVVDGAPGAQWTPKAIQDVLRSPSNLVVAALSRMTRLASLELDTGRMDITGDTFVSLLAKNCSFQLESFSTSLPVHTGLLQFLGTQSSIKEFRFCHRAPLYRVTPRNSPALPALQSLGWGETWDIRIPQALAQGRVINGVNIDFGSISMREDDSILERIDLGQPTTDQVTSARLKFAYSPKAVHFRAIYSVYGNLNTLNIELSTLSVNFILLVASCLQDMPHLRHLFIRGSRPGAGDRWAGWDNKYKASENQIKQTLSHLHASLFCILGSGGRGHLYLTTRKAQGCNICKKFRECDWDETVIFGSPH